MSKPFYKVSALAAAIIAAQMSAPQLAYAADATIEEVVVTGSRAKARSTTESPAPVDVFSGDDFTNQGDTDISNLLRNAIPSYNVSDQPISDAATLVRPANLRGLAPDHALVLVNGKRRHRAAVITWLGNGISNGSQGADTSAIPALALKSVEVLRDGAAAQYGSDAIAGVLNFNLKDASEGGSIEVRYGQYSEGDGEQSTIAANFGFALGDNGFINLTGQFGSSDATSRSEQRADAQTLIDAGYTGVPTPAMIWGRPIVDDDIKLFVNFGMDLGAAEIYGYANHNSKDVDGGFFYRNPTNRGGVYSNDSGATLLVGDLTPNDGIACPVVTMTGVTPDPAAFAAIVADPNCFSFQETIPGGFTPRFGGEVIDDALLLGLKGEMDNGIGWDVSAYYGNSKADFFINNTVNASLGPNTPRDFDPGYYEQTDTNLAADFTYSVSDTVNLAFGAEYRNEEFTIGEGQVESYTAGPLGVQGFSTSSNGFPGFPDVTSGSFDRANYAVYVEGDFDVTDDLLVQAALRYEDFEDFGTTTNYKIGVNYRLNEDFGLRGTYGTGFKAPTPGQSNASNTSTELTGGVLVNNGTIPATSPVALANGSKPLEAEESTNLTLGAYLTVGAFDITVDFFDIDVEDRLNLSSEVSLTPAQIAQLVADNVPGAGDLTQFRFFTNDFDTNTRGFDIIVSTDTEWLNGVTKWNLAYNNTRTEVTRFNAATIGAARIRQIEETTPDTRWNLSANHMLDSWRFLARVSYYDEWFDSFENDVFGTDAVFNAEMLLDLEVAYDINEHASILVGGNNVFNNSGQEATNVNNTGSNSAAVLGNTFSQYSPFGISGAFYYGRFQYTL